MSDQHLKNVIFQYPAEMLLDVLFMCKNIYLAFLNGDEYKMF